MAMSLWWCAGHERIDMAAQKVGPAGGTLFGGGPCRAYIRGCQPTNASQSSPDGWWNHAGSCHCFFGLPCFEGSDWMSANAPNRSPAQIFIVNIQTTMFSKESIQHLFLFRIEVIFSAWRLHWNTHTCWSNMLQRMRGWFYVKLFVSVLTSEQGFLAGRSIWMRL